MQDLQIAPGHPSESDLQNIAVLKNATEFKNVIHSRQLFLRIFITEEVTLALNGLYNDMNSMQSYNA